MTWFTSFFLAAATLSAQTLTGVVDIHAHSDPDSVPRSIDAIDAAKLARSRGIRGLVMLSRRSDRFRLLLIGDAGRGGSWSRLDRPSRLVILATGLLELLDGFAKTLGEFGQLAAAEKQQQHRENE